jgi:hypothetical protein
MKVSFIHGGGEAMASYRYRASIPARELGASVNDLNADILVFTKPMEKDVDIALAAEKAGKTIIADFCDPHFERREYRELCALADYVTCTTSVMAAIINAKFIGDATVIPDTYEFPEVEPHCRGNRSLWFGHGSNFPSLARVLPQVSCPLIIVSNLPMARPWSTETMYREFADADIVLLPATEAYKSPNRAMEAIRQGCFVVAEPQPAVNEIPGIWVGEIGEGIEWASQNQSRANERTKQAQAYIKEKFSPQTQACAWKRLFDRVKSDSISGAVMSTGTDG